jgi:serine/threonine protein kinase
MCAKSPPFTAKGMEELYQRVQKGVFPALANEYYSKEL